MNQLLVIKQEDNNPRFSHRRAARAVVVNAQGEVALLKVNKHAYHKLPGGGIEKDEDIPQALHREILEEIGCKVAITAEIGEVVEYRSKWDLKQTSYCYLATQVGAQQVSAFTPKESRDGFQAIWVPNVDTAISLVAKDKPANYDGHFIQQRDLAVLRAAKLLL